MNTEKRSHDCGVFSIMEGVKVLRVSVAPYERGFRHEKGSWRMWTTNHSNSYPGWESYSGYNMVNDQQQVYELKSVSTEQEWQESLRDPENPNVAAPSRFERYRMLLDEHCGSINVDAAAAILSDRIDSYSGKERPKYEPSVSNNILATI